MRVLIAGDFSQKNRIDAVVQTRSFGQLFDQIVPIVSSADYSIINLEFPIVLGTTEPRPIPKLGPHLKGSIEAVDAVKYAGFKCCTLANNHILDQGEKCCIDTKTELEKAGIDTVGVGNNLDEAGEVFYKNVDSERLAIINCCEREFSIATESSAGANPLNPIQQFYKIQEARAKADYVLVIVHGGHEHYQLPSPRMQETYRFFIDAGADAVVNGHQHCYSGFETYKDKPIVYGIGNFCFDNPQKVQEKWNEGYMVMLKFENGRAIIDHLFPYTQCDSSLGTHPMVNDAEFRQRIEELNQIIASPEKLKQKTDEYYLETAKHYLDGYEPYNNKLFVKLHSMGLLPSLMGKSKMLSIWNHTECEAHRDISLFALKSLFKKNI